MWLFGCKVTCARRHMGLVFVLQHPLLFLSARHVGGCPMDLRCHSMGMNSAAEHVTGRCGSVGTAPCCRLQDKLLGGAGFCDSDGLVPANSAHPQKKPTVHVLRFGAPCMSMWCRYFSSPGLPTALLGASAPRLLHFIIRTVQDRFGCCVVCALC